MSLSPIFRLIDAGGLTFFCNTDRCGSNLFMHDEDEGWMCNSCKVRPHVRPGAKFYSIPERQTETTNTVPVSLDPQ